MRIIQKPLTIVRTNLRPYLIINALMYGLCLVGFGLALVFPDLRADQLASLEANGTLGLVRSLLSNVWLFAGVILVVNTLTVGALLIVLPSMVLPFAGIALFAYKAFTLGLTLAPADEAAWVGLIPHSLTWLIEFQAYVLLTLGAYLLGNSWLRPRGVGAKNRRQGYLRGLRQIGWLALPALALLVVGAIYEAFSLIYLIGPLIQVFRA